MSDLEMLEELLVDLRVAEKCTFAELARNNSTARQAIERVRNAYKSGELAEVSLSLANFFDDTRRRIGFGCASVGVTDGRGLENPGKAGI